MSEIIGKVRFEPQTKKINSGLFPAVTDYSQNSEYIAMLREGNFIEITREQSQLLSLNFAEGVEMCVINGKLEPYVVPDGIKLEEARGIKLAELQSIYSSEKTWEVTLQDTDGTLTQTSDWLLSKISTTPIFYDDNDNVVKKTFTVNKVFEIIDKINIRCFKVLTAKKTITKKINSAETITDIENIDIKSEFEKIDKIIEIS